MKAIGKLFKLLVFVTWVGGWGLSAAALHVVRSEQKVSLIPKERLGFTDTYVDVRTWTPADVAAHPVVSERIIATGKGELLAHVGTIDQLAHDAKVLGAENGNHFSPPPTIPTEKPVKSKSIFD